MLGRQSLGGGPRRPEPRPLPKGSPWENVLGVHGPPSADSFCPIARGGTRSHPSLTPTTSTPVRAVNHQHSPSLVLAHWLRVCHMTQADQSRFFPRILARSEPGTAAHVCSSLGVRPENRETQFCREEASWPGRQQAGLAGVRGGCSDTFPRPRMSLLPEPPAGRAPSKLGWGGWLPAGLIGISVP